MDLVLAILIVSSALQLLAAAMALRLVRHTGFKAVWVILSAAFVLMLARRLLTLLGTTNEPWADVWTTEASEIMALATSVLLVVSMWRVGVVLRERRLIEAALRGTSDRYRQITDNIEEVFWLSDVQTGEMLYVSPAYDRIWGRPRGDFLRDPQSLLETVHPEDRARVAAWLAEVGVRPLDEEFRIVRPDGEVRWVRDRAFPFQSAPDGRRLAVGIAGDVTERHRIEESLRASEERHRALSDKLNLIMSQMPVVVWTTDLELRFTSSRGAGLSMLHLDPDQVVGMPLAEFLGAGEAGQVALDAHRRAAQGEEATYILDYYGRSYQSIVQPLRDDSGRIVGCIGVASDITARMQTEESLRQAEARYRTLFEQSPDGVLVVDPRTLLAVDFNDSICGMLGYSREEFARLRITDYEAAETAEEARAHIERVLVSGREDFETRLRRRTGQIIDVIVKVRAIDLGGRRLLHSILRDISHRKRSERRQVVMMRELDHRVKNNLAAVVSLAEQSARSSKTVGEFSDKFLGRIRAMAQMHSVLARTHWHGADLRPLIEQILEAFHVPGHARVVLEGPDVVLPAGAAAPLAMALHELATNAVKYGALSVAGGQVHVAWQVEPAGDDGGRVRLTWAESGGPPVKPGASPGFGTELICGGIAFEMRGKAEMKLLSDGLTCEITLRLDGAVPAPETQDMPSGPPDEPSAAP